MTHQIKDCPGNELGDACNDCTIRAELERVKGQRDRAVQYAHHTEDCVLHMQMTVPKSPCRCGLTELLKELDAK